MFISVIKHVVGVVSSSGSTILVRNVAKAFLPSDQGLFSKIATTTATVVIGSMVGTAAAKHTGEIIDETIEMVDEVRGVIKEKAKDDK